MRKIKLVLIHESKKTRNELSLILKNNFPLLHVVGSYNTKSKDLFRSFENNPDLFLLSSNLDLSLNENFINKLKSNSEFILLINDYTEAFSGFKFGANDVMDKPYTLEKLLFSINKYYWIYFLKLVNKAN
jgi:hypothetical protein